MSNIGNYAKLELEILEKSTGDKVILPFKKELIALAEAFGNSGQSGGSVAWAAATLSNAIYKLLLSKPITEITGADEEWSDYPKCDGVLQNSRCDGLVKLSNGECQYTPAILFRGEAQYEIFYGTKVYIDRHFILYVSSVQKINEFPFTPRTFYLDVEWVPISKELADNLKIRCLEDEHGDYGVYVLKNKEQLEDVGKYYNLEILKDGQKL